MPFRPGERQYREFAASNFTHEERDAVLDGGESNYTISGYFTTFRSEYPLFPDFYESIDPHAFDECDMSDVILQMNHDGFVYARTRNKSLQITFDDHGGHCVADLSGSKQGREDLYEAITNGLIDRMSFGFIIAEDGFEWEEDEDGVIHSRITKISKLFDVSAIAGFPANEGTEIHARDYVQAEIDAKHEAERIAAEQAEAERLAEEQRAAEEAAEQERIATEATSRRKRRARAMQL